MTVYHPSPTERPPISILMRLDFVNITFTRGKQEEPNGVRNKYGETKIRGNSKLEKRLPQLECNDELPMESIFGSNVI